MEDVQQVTIPTLSKAKISHMLSYPIGARDVSTALSSAVQLPELKLHFYSGFDIDCVAVTTSSCEWNISTMQHPHQSGLSLIFTNDRLSTDGR